MVCHSAESVGEIFRFAVVGRDSGAGRGMPPGLVVFPGGGWVHRRPKYYLGRGVLRLPCLLVLVPGVSWSRGWPVGVR